MPPVLVSAALLLAAVLLGAAVGKWRHRDSLRSSARLLGVGDTLAAASVRLPEIEVVLALALLLVPWPKPAVLVAAAVLGLMVAYTVVIARGLTMVPRPACSCFGTVGSPISARTLLRNLMLTALAGVHLGWTLDGHTVPGALAEATATEWGWLAALVVTALVTASIVGDRRPAAPTRAVTVDDEPIEEGELLDYQRAPIPAVMLLEEDRPVTLAVLARQRAQLLVWVTCGCERSHQTLRRVQEWREQVPEIDVRMVSTMRTDHTEQIFSEAPEEPWLYDPEGQALTTLDVDADPVALLLGADGLLAGGPVAGTADVADFGDQVVAQLTAN